ncbi:MAG TPA: hypothetical protein VHD90_12740 [Phototrophicaceae bacterium]|nr:hypothetical protein [Phototrophicaceae bacterium]
MSIQGLLFALLLALFLLAWIILPLFQREAPPSQEDPLLDKQRERLLVYYERVLRNIRDLDEDHALGKLDEAEYTRERTDWSERGVQVLQALDTLKEREVIAPTPAEDTAVDHAIDDAIEAAIRRYRQRNPQ